MLTLDNLRKKISGEGAENIKESPSILGEKKKRKKRKSAEDSYPQSVYNRRIHDEEEYGVYDKEGNPVRKKKGKKSEDTAKMNPKLGTPKDSDANMNENINDLKYDADIHSDGKMTVGKKPDGKICLYGKSYHSHDHHKEVADKMGMVATDHTKTMGGTRTVLSKKKLGEARMVKTRGRFDPVVKKDVQNMAKHPRYKGNNSKLEKDIRKKHPEHADNFVIQNIIRKHAEMHEAVKMGKPIKGKIGPGRKVGAYGKLEPLPGEPGSIVKGVRIGRPIKGKISKKGVPASEFRAKNEATKGLRIAVGRNRVLQRHLDKRYGPKDVSSRMKKDLEKKADKKNMERRMKNMRVSEETSNPSDDDGANHIVMQLRKSVTLRGMRPVTFKDGKKVKVSPEHAQKWLSNYNNAKPETKRKMQSMAHKSHDHFQKSLGEGVLSTLGKAAGWASGITPAMKIAKAAGRGVKAVARAGYEKATGGGLTRKSKMDYHKRKTDKIASINKANQAYRDSKQKYQDAKRGMFDKRKKGDNAVTSRQKWSYMAASNESGSKK